MISKKVTPSNRRPVYGSATEDLTPGEFAEEQELLDSLAGQITGDGPPEFYCKPLGQLLGPMSLTELRIMAESGSLAEDDLVRYGETRRLEASRRLVLAAGGGVASRIVYHGRTHLECSSVNSPTLSNRIQADR
ncbi:MAG: hypothetical protein U0936_17520 [Planctomycetaceae bacterium]